MIANALKSMKNLVDSGDLSVKIERVNGVKQVKYVILSYGLFELFYLQDYEVSNRRKSVMKALGLNSQDLARERFAMLLRGIRSYINYLFGYGADGSKHLVTEFDFYVMDEGLKVTHKGHFGGKKDIVTRMIISQE